MKNEIRSIKVYVYQDDLGHEHISSVPYKSTELQGYSLVHTENVVITFPAYNKNEHMIRALEMRQKKIGDNAKSKQSQVYKQIEKLGGNHE